MENDLRTASNADIFALVAAGKVATIGEPRITHSKFRVTDVAKEIQPLNPDADTYIAGMVKYSCPKIIGGQAELKSVPQRIKPYVARALVGYEGKVPVETIHVSVQGDAEHKRAIFHTAGMTYRSISRLLPADIDDTPFQNRLEAEMDAHIAEMMGEEPVLAETTSKKK